MRRVVPGLALGQLMRQVEPEYRFPRREADVCWCEQGDERKHNAYSFSQPCALPLAVPSSPTALAGCTPVRGAGHLFPDPRRSGPLLSCRLIVGRCSPRWESSACHPNDEGHAGEPD